MAEYNRPITGVGAMPETEYLSATTRIQSQRVPKDKTKADVDTRHRPLKNAKYGELAPKRKPLISMDHERAFFDSADWALCKQGVGVQKSTVVAVESLRPKLKRTPPHKLPPRMPTCTSGGDRDVGTTA